MADRYQTEFEEVRRRYDEIEAIMADLDPLRDLLEQAGFTVADDRSSRPEEPAAKQLQEILAKHEAWRLGEPDGVRADLRGADLRKAILRKADLRGADLSEADLRGADLRKAILRKADLRGADLRWANLSEADLHEADLHGADLRGADLSEAILREADLREADLHGADLRGADLSEAILREADLREADLSGADLRGANLSRANLSRAIGLPIAADAPARLRAVAEAALSSDDALRMEDGHSCNTLHCIAGLATHQAGELGRLLEITMGTEMAGLMLLGIEAHSHFYDTDAEAKAYLESVLKSKEVQS